MHDAEDTRVRASRRGRVSTNAGRTAFADPAGYTDVVVNEQRDDVGWAPRGFEGTTLGGSRRFAPITSGGFRSHEASTTAQLWGTCSRAAEPASRSRGSNAMARRTDQRQRRRGALQRA